MSVDSELKHLLGAGVDDCWAVVCNTKQNTFNAVPLKIAMAGKRSLFGVFQNRRDAETVCQNQIRKN